MTFRWHSLFDKLRGSRGHTPIVSFVLLERKFEALSEDLLLERAQSAYKIAKPKDIELLKDRFPESRILRVENFFFAFHQAPQQYTRPPSEGREVIDQAWDSHVCWSSFDLAAPELEEKDKPTARRVMLHFVNLLWSPNTTGLFFPDRGLTVPNMGGLTESIRWATLNGIPLRDLFSPVTTTKTNYTRR